MARSKKQEQKIGLCAESKVQTKIKAMKYKTFKLIVFFLTPISVSAQICGKPVLSISYGYNEIIASWTDPKPTRYILSVYRQGADPEHIVTVGQSASLSPYPPITRMIVEAQGIQGSGFFSDPYTPNN